MKNKNVMDFSTFSLAESTKGINVTGSGYQVKLGDFEVAISVGDEYEIEFFYKNGKGSMQIFSTTPGGDIIFFRDNQISKYITFLEKSPNFSITELILVIFRDWMDGKIKE